MIRSVIIGTGSCIPEIVVKNAAFANAQFFAEDGTKVYTNTIGVIDKFRQITGITERRYATHEQTSTDLAYLAALDAITSAGIDKESLDYIIVAHNFGEVKHQSNRVSMVPTLASKVKALLNINNPDCVAYDLPFGCPGWVQGLIHANYFIRSGDAKRCLVIGTETLSRVVDPHDRDSMIFSDGSGAAILEASESGNHGLLSYKAQTHAADHASLLNMSCSYSPFGDDKNDLFIKMNGHKVYEFALQHVPPLIKEVIDSAEVSIDAISKILIHQANEKMDQAILTRVYKLFGKSSIPPGVMPMTIEKLGNSSVATVPTLLDLILKGKMPEHTIEKGNKVIMASVGAGMNINAVLYQF